MNRFARAFALSSLLVLSACATYIPPGDKADLRALAPADIQAGFAAKPSAPFPASIAAVRIQGAGYSNHFTRTRGGGTYAGDRFAVITMREIERDEHFDAIAKLPQVTGVIGINRMLLPDRMETDRDLRVAASRLQADLLLLYTFDTRFLDTNVAAPLSAITLGFAPTRNITTAATVSAVLLDTRTGYVYGAYENTARRDAFATSWGARDTIDATRQATELDAFGKLVDDFVASWPKLLDRHAPRVAR